MTNQMLEISSRVSEFLKGTKKLFINGEFVESTSSRTFETVNPATGEVLTTVYEAGEKDIDFAVKAAKKAFEEGPWSRMSAAEKAKLLFKLADLIEENKEEFAQLDTLDNGKPISECRTVDIPGTFEMFRYFAGWTTKNMGQTIPVSGNFLNYTRHEPVGVVGQIIPWNFPVNMLSWKIAPALAAGCTVVLKPAEQTPLSALYFAELVHKAGFPAGVVNIVPGFGQIAGQALAEHPDVNKLAFTGSTAVGKHLMKQAADTMKRLTLELGGKSPNIILPDADLSKAIPGVFTGIMFNQGEVCSAGSRVYVHKSQYEEVISGMVALAKEVKLGNGLDEETTMGPLVSKKQQDRVFEYINIGIKEGAKLAAGGGKREEGFFIEPTIFTDVEEHMTIAKEEIFGPVVVVMSYDSVEEVIERANSSAYGLGAGVWTENLKTAHNIANQLKSGSVWINCYDAIDPASPFGGYKESGFGREMGSYALENYTEVKSVWVSLD
ncbi:aldehyde dehydrogenase family protein [Pseudobacillus badius]|uniref:aldehyde dehydrogenase family protein n=1 Tax=Bacillus badius TaxID=1455 RepID=UPI0005971FEE|nr:aldehyde dehydrogenase family protein [Bacillus badius]KIL74012.1 Aldehyde dehydrogenase [Bacillus badius]UAT32832.1 aldehyde dehydrogenase family protein [Bacillus badius]GLY11873.1 aldehyde dehydrogenase [Bacillus badius]